MFKKTERKKLTYSEQIKFLEQAIKGFTDSENKTALQGRLKELRKYSDTAQVVSYPSNPSKGHSDPEFAQLAAKDPLLQTEKQQLKSFSRGLGEAKFEFENLCNDNNCGNKPRELFRDVADGFKKLSVDEFLEEAKTQRLELK